MRVKLFSNFTRHHLITHTNHLEKAGDRDKEKSSIAHLHDVVIWLQIPEFISLFLYYLNFEFPVGFKTQLL